MYILQYTDQNFNSYQRIRMNIVRKVCKITRPNFFSLWKNQNRVEAKDREPSLPMIQ